MMLPSENVITQKDSFSTVSNMNEGMGISVESGIPNERGEINVNS